ncbi:response regulator transcription factor [Pelosinus sp. sgz500959]|uniref:response regulator transcription factor n=1 Tax=Pelosinus sp. sgz500959 TaxID=3242472 RepID=UPI00366DAF88
MKILIAEDDQRFGNLVYQMLLRQNMQVDWVHSGDDALDFIKNELYDVIILDWMMPKKTGLEVCKELREEHYQGGILMLTAKDTVDDLVVGLEAGADDYIVKPFEFKELLARIQSVARRSKVALKEECVKAADLELNRGTKLAKRGTRMIQLTGREFQLLDILMQNYGRVLPKELILDHIWGLESEISPNNLEAFVRLLRKKIDYPGEEELIQNIRGVGYKMEARKIVRSS